jgi:hypothetical protein
MNPFARAVLITGCLAAAALAAAASASTSPATGPCPQLPPAIKLPPGVPSPCTKKQGKSPFEIKVNGSVTAAFTAHSGNWGHCTPALGGGAHTDASTGLDFGQESWETAQPSYRTTAGTKIKYLGGIEAEPSVEMTLEPKQDQRHEVPPGCLAMKDATTCSRIKGAGGATVHLDSKTDAVTLSLRTPTVLTMLCAAPFTGGDNLFAPVSFKHPLDEEDLSKLSLLGTPKWKGHSMTIDWSDPTAPCSDYGGPKVGSTGGQAGSLDACTIKADFQIVVRHLS